MVLFNILFLYIVITNPFFIKKQSYIKGTFQCHEGYGTVYTFAFESDYFFTYYNIAQNIIETGTYNKLNEKEHLLEFEDTSIVVILEDDQFSFPVEINDKLLIASFEKVLNVPAYQTFD